MEKLNEEEKKGNKIKSKKSNYLKVKMDYLNYKYYTIMSNNKNEKMKKSILTIAITMISTLSMLSQSWTQVGAGLSSNVNSLYTDASVNKLYATGAFTGKVAYLSGTTWSVVPSYTGTAGNSILSYSSSMSPQTLIVCADKVYSYQSGWTARSVAGNFTASVVDSLYDYLYVSGVVGGLSKIFKYDMTDLTIAPVTYTAPVGITVLNILNGDLYMAGGFGLMKTDLATFSAAVYVGTAINVVNIKCLSINSTNLYVSGDFDGFAGTANSYNLTSYNGTSFNSFGTFMFANTTSLGQHKFYNGKLYVVHNTAAGPGMTSKVEVMASPTSTSSALPTVSSPTSTMVLTNTQTINTMAVYNGELYVGGSLVVSTGGSGSFSNIAKYNSGITTGVNEMSKANTTLVYPNPSNGVVNIATEYNSEVNVINNLGQIVLHFTADSKVSNVNIENAGVYTVQISKNNQVSNSRLIIQ